MVQRAVAEFYKRVGLCVQVEGRQFKPMRRHTEDLNLRYDMAVSGAAEYEGDMEEWSAGVAGKDGEEAGQGEGEEQEVEEVDVDKGVNPQ